MVIVSPILERDETRGDTLHNTAGKLRRPTFAVFETFMYS